MLSFIQFFASFLFPPGIFILIILVLAILMIRSNKKWAVIWLSVGLFFYLCTIPLVADTLARAVEKQYLPPSEIQGDSIILLTSGVTTDTPGMLGKGMPTDETAGRIIAAAALHYKYELPIIIAGGQVYNGSGNESEITMQSLLSIGVEESAIILDNTSRTTAENAKNVKEILLEKGYQSPILVTSAMHMPRSIANFENNDVSVTPYPTAYLSNTSFQFHAGQITPSDHALAKTGHAFKEMLGLIAAHIFDV